MATVDGRSLRATPNRGVNVAFWVLQSLLAAVFLMAGVVKLAGVEAMVKEFEVIGLGQWFRYLTGVLEIVAAVLLVIPGKSGYGAVLVACIMVGAAAAHVVVLGDSPVVPLVLLVLAAVIVWGRLVHGPKASVLREATHP